MRSHKKPSILDFFSPVPRKPQGSANNSTTLQDASSTRAGPATLPSRIHLQDNSTSHSTNTSFTHSSPSASVPPASANNHEASPNAQPPTTSQTSTNSGVSKRVISNGEHVVLNSDSDDDSLEELDFGVPTTSFKIVAPTTRSKRTTQHDEDGLRKPEKKVRSKKTRIDQVVETAQKSRELERVINEHKADLEIAVDESSYTDFVFDEHALGHAVHDDDDPEKAHRLFRAMQRTNANHFENVYRFFSDTSSSPTAKPPFPTACLPEHRWTATLRDETTRDQSFLTGFAQQVFRLQDLPKELASWMIDQICLSQNDAIDLKYMEILEAHDQYLKTLLDWKRLENIFRHIGADLKAVHSNAGLVPLTNPSTEGTTPLPRSINSIVRLLERAAPHLRTKARSYVFNLLCHTCLDDRVLAQQDILAAVQDALEAVLCNFVDNQKLIHGLNDILPQLLAQVTHPVMQRNLVCALPAKSPLTAYFQRHLALSMLVYPSIVDVPLADSQMPAFVHKLLKTSPNFRISKDTNYHYLTARITLLDVAIGPGLLLVPYQPLVSPVPSQPGSSPIMLPVPEPDEVKDFNRAVDSLAQQIKILGNSIIEAGAVADLTILNAKDCVERLCARLEHAVRIGGKKMHDVFGSEDEEKQLKVTDIFRRVAKARKVVPPGGIFDQDDDVDDAIAAQIEAETAS